MSDLIDRQAAIEVIDASVVWQSNFPQGQGVYDTIESPWGSVMYFCY